MTVMNRRLAAMMLSLGLALAAGSGLAADAPQVKLATTAGDIVIEVYPDKAPKTAENFLRYVKDKHYNGTVFHRVISGFMIQGGDPLGTGTGSGTVTSSPGTISCPPDWSPRRLRRL